MRLEFRKGFVLDSLYEDLDFEGFLSLFDLDIPLVPAKILCPMNEKEGKKHFKRLSTLQTTVDRANLDLTKVIDQTRKLPVLDSVLPFFKQGELKQFHLFTLGGFVTKEIVLQELEAKAQVFPKPEKCLNLMKEILASYTQDDFSSLLLSLEEKDLENRIGNFHEKLQDKLLQYEKDIYDQTGFKMIYPFPKELNTNDKDLARAKKCGLLSVSKDRDICLIDYKLTPDIKDVIAKKEKLSKSFEKSIQDKLDKLNKELGGFYKEFVCTYENRKSRTFDYVLLYAKDRYSLCLPQFYDSTADDFGGCKLKKAVLSVLKEQRKEKYIPLDIHLSSGATVLFGANMTGKTAVLKTVCFILTAIRAGLPIPAESAELHFPDQVGFHFKSLGDFRENLSGFGEEIEFFTKKVSSKSYILVDELFGSTDPSSGTELSRIFLSEFAKKDVIFFCTSHYPEVLNMDNINLFRMKDAAFDNEIKGSAIWQELLDRTPFQAERIDRKNVKKILSENRKPLQIALHFSLPESIKKKIRLVLKGDS